MDKVKLKQFFDSRAAGWDEACEHKPAVIRRLLSCAHGAKKVLDVGCGTGVLEPYLIEFGANEITAVDLSQLMIERAREKYPQVDYICGDVLTLPLEENYDLVIVYNAYPHFPDGEALVKRLAGLTRIGGQLIICHGSSREEINARHADPATKEISNELPEAIKLAGLMGKYCKVTKVLDDAECYEIVGTKNHISGITPVLQNSLGHRNNCTVCSMAVVLSYYMSHGGRCVRFAPVYDTVVKYAKRCGFNLFGRGTNPFFIQLILWRAERFLRVNLRSRVAYIRGVGYNLARIKKLIDSGTPVVLSFLRAGKYKNHTVTVIGYEKSALIICDNWTLSPVTIDYKKISRFSSINWLS